MLCLFVFILVLYTAQRKVSSRKCYFDNERKHKHRVV